MNWKILGDEIDLDLLLKESFIKPQIIFKHSTRCSISAMAKGRLDRFEPGQSVVFHYLDILKNRRLSNSIAEKLNVHHESPQVLVIKEGECIYAPSHWEIEPKDIIESLESEA